MYGANELTAKLEFQEIVCLKKHGATLISLRSTCRGVLTAPVMMNTLAMR